MGYPRFGKECEECCRTCPHPGDSTCPLAVIDWQIGPEEESMTAWLDRTRSAKEVKNLRMTSGELLIYAKDGGCWVDPKELEVIARRLLVAEGLLQKCAAWVNDDWPFREEIDRAIRLHASIVAQKGEGS